MANTVKVRIAVAVCEDGNYIAYGNSALSKAECASYVGKLVTGSRRIIEKEIIIPEIQTIQAKQVTEG